MTDWQREDNLLYTLEHDGWAKGVEQFRNRLMVRFEKGRDVPQEEIEKAMALFLAAPDMLTVLEAIRKCELKRDENGHVYLKVPARSMFDLGSLVTQVSIAARYEQPQLDSPQGE